MDAITLAFYNRNIERLPLFTSADERKPWMFRQLKWYSEQCAIKYNSLFCQDRPKRGKSRVMQLSRMYPANVQLFTADEQERREESEYSHSEGAHR